MMKTALTAKLKRTFLYRKAGRPFPVIYYSTTAPKSRVYPNASCFGFAQLAPRPRLPRHDSTCHNHSYHTRLIQGTFFITHFMGGRGEEETQTRRFLFLENKVLVIYHPGDNICNTDRAQPNDLTYPEGHTQEQNKSSS